MTRRVFVDTDVILDVALARKPFLEGGRTVLALLENSLALGFITSNSAGNLYYILRKAGGEKKTRLFLSRLLKYLTVVPVDHSTVIEALNSNFTDFEDALQNYSAEKNRCECLVTRNIKDYKKLKMNIYLPSEFVRLYQ